MKVVVNTCHGGFGLSHDGVVEYAKRMGIALRAVRTGEVLVPWDYWVVPEDEQAHLREQQRRFYEMTIEQRKEFNERYRKAVLIDSDIPRSCPALVSMIEENSELYSGGHADLKVVEIPDDVKWEIEEYDGMEWVAEKHRTWR